MKKKGACYWTYNVQWPSMWPVDTREVFSSRRLVPVWFYQWWKTVQCVKLNGNIKSKQKRTRPWPNMAFAPHVFFCADQNLMIQSQRCKERDGSKWPANFTEVANLGRHFQCLSWIRKQKCWILWITWRLGIWFQLHDAVCTIYAQLYPSKYAILNYLF